MSGGVLDPSRTVDPVRDHVHEHARRHNEQWIRKTVGWQGTLRSSVGAQSAHALPGSERLVKNIAGRTRGRTCRARRGLFRYGERPRVRRVNRAGHDGCWRKA